MSSRPRPISGPISGLIHPTEITGLILAGGQGRRMGGIDKGLKHFLGTPLALHALRRLSPQAGRVAISANRNLATYEAMGVPAWPDPSNETWIDEAVNDPGPLAGPLAGALDQATDPCHRRVQGCQPLCKFQYLAGT